MKFLPKILISFVIAIAHCYPHITEQLDESSQNSKRAIVTLKGTQVTVITGIIIKSVRLQSCLFDSGVDIAKEWAGALADQWFFSAQIKSTEVKWSSLVVDNLFCGTFDAIFTLASKSDAQKFATAISHIPGIGSNKRHVARPRFDASKMEIYIEGVDLPSGHPYFGMNETVDVTSTTSIAKRNGGIGKCQNKCDADFTHAQTGPTLCRDTTFPIANHAFC